MKSRRRILTASTIFMSAPNAWTMMTPTMLRAILTFQASPSFLDSVILIC